MSVFDICAEATASERFNSVREKVDELITYMQAAGKRPTEVCLFAGDYRVLQSAITRRLEREAKQKEKAENEARKAKRIKEKAKVEPDRVDGLYYKEIILKSHAYSRPRRVEA